MLTLLAFAAHKGWCVRQINFKTAFLNAEMRGEKIFVRPPEGYEDLCTTDEWFLLLKALYGLKQSGRLWYLDLSEHIISLGFVKSRWDDCLWLKYDSDGTLLAALLSHVDDCLIVSPTKPMVIEIEDLLATKYQLTKQGDVHYFLKKEITRTDNNTFLIKQTGYITDLALRFKEHLAAISPKPHTPMLPSQMDNTPASAIPDDDVISDVPYRELVGSLIHATHTHPEIQFAVGYVGRYSHRHTRKHWETALRILAYLDGVKSEGMEIGMKLGEDGEFLRGFVDSSFGDDAATGRSTTGVALTLGVGVIYARSRLQRRVATSSTQAEFHAAWKAAQMTIALRGILREFRLIDDKTPPTRLYKDNTGCVAWSRNNIDHDRATHLDVYYHSLREWVTTAPAKHRNNMRCAQARIRRRIQNLVNEVHKKVALWLVRTFDIILLPAFRSTQMSMRRPQRRISSTTVRKMLTWAHGRFLKRLFAKAEEFGKKVVVLPSEAYTSKTYSRCGQIRNNLGGARVFRCRACGYVVDRDVNGARGILFRALSFGFLTLH